MGAQKRVDTFFAQRRTGVGDVETLTVQLHVGAAMASVSTARLLILQ